MLTSPRPGASLCLCCMQLLQSSPGSREWAGLCLFFSTKMQKRSSKQHSLQILEEKGGAAIQLFWLPPHGKPSVSNTQLSQMFHSCFPFPMPLHYPAACLSIVLPTSTCSHQCAVLGGGWVLKCYQQTLQTFCWKHDSLGRDTRNGWEEEGSKVS